MRINSICVLGGGTAGFSISSLLSRYKELSGLDFDIKLVYSEKIKTIGVGESSILNINDLFNYLGIDEKQWMRKCDATYKVSLKFTDFNKGSHFYYPLGKNSFDRKDNTLRISDWFISKEFNPDLYTPENAATYISSHNILAQKNKLIDKCRFKSYVYKETGEYDVFQQYNLKNSTAYHFDSSKLGDVLKEYSIERGVEIINDTFIDAKMNDDGSIKELVCEGGNYDADLFVDCSGFESLLLGKIMKEDFISYSDTLINDKALVAKVPYTDKEKQLKNYTDSIALKNGWCWEIPLWNHMSVGYVHTNKFASEKEIEKEFFDRYGEVEYKTVHYKTGRYKRGWVKNVVGIGLAYGFIEPLESTGLATTFVNCFKLLEIISKRDLNYTQIDRDIFSYAVGNSGIDYWRSVVMMHYFLSIRNDSNYWKYVTEDVNYDKDINSEFSYKSFIHKCSVTRDLSSESGPIYIITGMGYSPFSRAHLLLDASKIPIQLKDGKRFEEFLVSLGKFADKLPSTFEFLRNNIYG